MESKEPEEYIIARELHKDGEFHLHVYWKNSKSVNIKNPSVLDVKGYHGNYQAMKSKVHWVKYVTKEDESALVFGIDPVKYLEEASNHKAVTGLLLQTVPVSVLV